MAIFDNDFISRILGGQPSSGQPVNSQTPSATSIAMPTLQNAQQQDYQNAMMNRMGQLGMMLVAAGQRMTPNERATMLAQAPQYMGGIQGDVMNAAQARLMAARAQQEQDEQSRQAAIQGKLNDPQFLAGLGIKPEMAEALGPDGIKKLIENQAMANTPNAILDRQLKVAQIKAANANLEKPQLITNTAPDGSIVQQWVKPGQTQGDIVGVPGPSKSQLKLQEQRDKEADAAANLLPVIERARNDYAEAIKKNAVGPFNASGANRAVANFFGTQGEGARQQYDKDLANVSALSTASLNKGQGAVSNFERKLYNARFPGLDSGTPEVGLKAFDEMIAEAKAKIGKSSIVAQPETSSKSSDPIAMAKDAIAKGADPEKVKQRLIERGINPAGL
jgi:hypothetical protein